jgi:asparagine synthase (glutamine-hydrolysing)
MCGIAGYISLSSTIEDNNVIVRMTNTLRHRGPDDEGYVLANIDSGTLTTWAGKDTRKDTASSGFNYTPKYRVDSDKFRSEKVNIALGHRRLSILDLSPSGHQPMCNKDGTIWIVYNGEIYNYIELREELENKGHTFVSKSDTEVLIYSYEEWGEECVHRFNGMWAFTILDLNKKSLFASRDRTGVKPFYYHYDGKTFIFASEIKALLNVVPLGINNGVVWDYLVLRTNHHFSETFYEGIMELEPSHSLSLRLSGELKEKRYWKPNVNYELGKFSKEELGRYTKELLPLIENAVELRLRSDVPVGSCLSGGLDSSTIVAVANKFLVKEAGACALGEKQKTFTSSFDDEVYDERKYANIVASKCKVEQHYIFPSAEGLISEIEKVMQIQEEPFISSSIYAQYKVMEKVRDVGVKVLLDGQGGDELFGGYYSYYFLNLVNLIKLCRLYEFVGEWRSMNRVARFGNIYQIYAFVKEASRLFPLKVQLFMRDLAIREIEFIDTDFLNSYKERARRWLETISEASLGKRLHADLIAYNLKGLLRYEDRNSMFFSIEARTPYADDYRLMEFMLSIPNCYKVREGWTKYIMRKTVEGLIPDEICWRKDKMGFVTPETKWLKKLLMEKKNELLTVNDHFFKKDHFRKQITNYLQSDKEHFTLSRIWRVINVEMWLSQVDRTKSCAD